jgi:TetR/AcrR family transcriptional repressor of uid operon
VATRRRIYEAAIEEFRRVGFDTASIARIAVRAGVSRPSFYFHFATKQHVLLEFQWVLENEVVGRIAEIESASEALHGFVESLVEIEARAGHGDLFRDVLHNWVRPPDDVDWETDAMPAVQAVRHRFEQAEAAGQLHEGFTSSRATLLFLTGVFGYLVGVPATGDDRRADLHALVDLYLTRAD